MSFCPLDSHEAGSLGPVMFHGSNFIPRETLLEPTLKLTVWKMDGWKTNRSFLG